MSFSLENQVPRESMKVEKDSVAGKFMAKSFPAATSSNSFAPQQPTSTPSHFSISSSRPPVDLLLRFLAFVFSFISGLSLVILLLQDENNAYFSTSCFGECWELVFCFVVTMIAFAYSLFQLFKGNMVSDYTSFIVDQVLVYTLVSFSSEAVKAIKKMEASSPLWKASIISVSFSFATSVVMAISSAYNFITRGSYGQSTALKRYAGTSGSGQAIIHGVM